MLDCTGEEILQELLFQIGFLDHYDDLVRHTKIITTMMPYITSQFMPRTLKDRPQVIPDNAQTFTPSGARSRRPSLARV
jgi:oleate hydratase